MSCTTCGGLGMVAAVDYNAIIHCPDCETAQFFQDCYELQIPDDEVVETTELDA